MEPLSTTSTSPRMPKAFMVPRAFSTHFTTVRSSFKHGMTTVNSRSSVVWSGEGIGATDTWRNSSSRVDRTAVAMKLLRACGKWVGWIIVPRDRRLWTGGNADSCPGNYRTRHSRKQIGGFLHEMMRRSSCRGRREYFLPVTQHEQIGLCRQVAHGPAPHQIDQCERAVHARVHGQDRSRAKAGVGLEKAWAVVGEETPNVARADDRQSFHDSPGGGGQLRRGNRPAVMGLPALEFHALARRSGQELALQIAQCVDRDLDAGCERLHDGVGDFA